MHLSIQLNLGPFLQLFSLFGLRAWQVAAVLILLSFSLRSSDELLLEFQQLLGYRRLGLREILLL